MTPYSRSHWHTIAWSKWTHVEYKILLLEPNFSMGCIIGEIGNGLESDPQNSPHEDLKEILSEEKITEGQTDPWKTSADRRVIATVDDEELQKRKASRIPQNTRTNTLRAARVWFEWAEERSDLIQIIGDSETIDILRSTFTADHKPRFQVCRLPFANY